jgi:hypothetical protein
MHLNNGQLRAYLDGEPQGGPERLAIDRHLAECAACQAHLVQVKAQVQQLQEPFAFLAEPLEGQVWNGGAARPALVIFKQRIVSEKETLVLKTIFKNVFRTRLAWVSLAVLVILAVGLSVPSGRSMAAQFLDLFRVKQITVLPVDPTGFTLLSGDSIMGRQIGQLLSDSITVQQAAGAPQPVADQAQASRKAGFNVRLPTGPAPDQMVVRGREAFTFVVDLPRAQALLDEAGRSDLVLPPSLDRAAISVDIPAGFGAAYGACPSLTAGEEGLGVNLNGSPGRQYDNCLLMAEMPSPTVDSPPDIDLAQLAQIGLEFSGMSPAEAKAYSQSVDWTTTLVVPIPKNAATYSQVNVDGVTGTLIQRPSDDAPQFALVWVKDGVIYAIGGLGSDSSRAIQLANAMP